MEQKDYQAVIRVDSSLQAAFESVKNDVTKWWAKDFKGSSRKLGDVFTVRFGETFVTFKVTEFIPDDKIEWTVTDCYLHWLNDKTEWTGTKIHWDFVVKEGKVLITMKHIGLTPELACYSDCSAGWNEHVKGSLYGLLSGRIGQPA